MLSAILIIIYKDKAAIADPICTFLFAVVVVVITKDIFRDCMLILMEGFPGDLRLEMVYQKLILAKGVEDVHDLHIFALSP